MERGEITTPAMRNYHTKLRMFEATKLVAMWIKISHAKKWLGSNVIKLQVSQLSHLKEQQI